MTTYALYDADTGQIAQTMAVPPELELAPVSGMSFLAVADGFSSRGHYVAGGMIVAMPQQPSNSHTFNWATKEWHDPRTLRDLKNAKWSAIRQAREAALAAPLITPYGVFDADLAASANIIKSVLRANNLTSLGYPVEINFTLHDNSVVVLDAPAMVQVGLILAAREQVVRDQATALRAQIEAANTPEQVAEVVWASP